MRAICLPRNMNKTSCAEAGSRSEFKKKRFWKIAKAHLETFVTGLALFPFE